MKTIESERGRTLKAPFEWVEFVIRNPDILAALNKSPLHASQIDEKRFALTIFGVHVNMEEVHRESNGKEGVFKAFADIRVPWGLGRTHTFSTYHYRFIDEDTTAIELALSIELTNFSMRLYAAWFRDRIDRYLNKVCTHIEHAAKTLSRGDESAAGKLDAGQTERIENFRVCCTRRRAVTRKGSPKMEGVLRILMSEDSAFVTAEARMPDQTFLTANGQFKLGTEERESLHSGMISLAGINNRALATRGSTQPDAAPVDFRQTALEYGYRFYRRVCDGQLSSVLPVITTQGRSAVLRISLEGEAEQLPWEAMHDGQEFLCIKTCLTRVLSNLQPGRSNKTDWDQTGILIVGADSRGDLPGVEREVNGIGEILLKAGASRFEVLSGEEAGRRDVIKALESGRFGILHFSGHSVFDQNYPYQSYMELCGGTRIFLHELGHFSHGLHHHTPLGLVFLNSCQSARVGQDSLTGRQLSLCKALRESGVNHVIGMLWNVEDEAAVQVGSSFYRTLLNSPMDGPESALRETRLEVAIERSWADGSWLAPVLYS